MGTRTGVSFVCGAGLAGTLAFSGAAGAAETRAYVVSWFHMASYNEDGDCAGGENPAGDVMMRQMLYKLGKSPAEVDVILKDYPNGKEMRSLLINRGRIDGQPVNIYRNPNTEPDPQIHTIQGHYAYGFNLDGKGVASPNGFEDPETHEKGVNNELFRALGCFHTQRAKPPARPTYPAIQWDMIRDESPAWIVEISGIDDPRNDEDVTVGIYRATGPVTRNSNGDPQLDMTYQIDRSPRSQNIVHGKLKDGVITTDRFDFNMIGDPFAMPEYHFKDAKLRLALKPDGSVGGILGGYHPWRPIYVSYALPGFTNEVNLSIDVPGIYYALKRLADAYPDPKTGENTAISSSFWIEAIPAFVVRPSENRTAAASRKGMVLGAAE